MGEASLRVIHTPGHTPGFVCLYASEADRAFTGDTLFNGGPGVGEFSAADDLVKDSIRRQLFALPHVAVVHAGHGFDTTLVAERPLMAASRIRASLENWLVRDEV